MSEELASSSIENIKNIPLNGETKTNLINRIYDSLSANPYFSAGAGLVGIGMVATISRKLIIVANTLLRRRFLSSLEIDNQDRYFYF